MANDEKVIAAAEILSDLAEETHYYGYNMKCVLRKMQDEIQHCLKLSRNLLSFATQGGASSRKAGPTLPKPRNP